MYARARAVYAYYDDPCVRRRRVVIDDFARRPLYWRRSEGGIVGEGVIHSLTHTHTHSFEQARSHVVSKIPIDPRVRVCKEHPNKKNRMSTSNQVRLPAELKHISKRRKRN